MTDNVRYTLFGVDGNALVAELRFISYQENRNANPSISVERWRLVYADISEADFDAMETRYQADRAKEHQS